VLAGSIQDEARVALGYVLHLTSDGGSEAYRIQQVFKAVPTLVQVLLRLGALCGETEYRAVLREAEATITSSRLVGNAYLRRRLRRLQLARRIFAMLRGLVVKRSERPSQP
jgi:hypothetical protein